MQCKDITGERFGRLTVVARADNSRSKKARWLCQCDCGKAVVVCTGSLNSGNTKTCGCGHHGSGSDNPNWKGGRVMKNGYVMLHAPDSPMAGSSGYVFEHRLVMASHIGRDLRPEEVVHHKDEDRANNHIDNLELLANVGAHNSKHKKGPT